MNRGDSLVSRLWNWGAYARIDEDKPDSSCANPIYENWIPSKNWDAGWGEPYPTERDVHAGPDEPDAVEMNGWIRQLAMAHKITIGRRFRDRCEVGKARLEEALDALDYLMASNRMTIERMRRLGVA